MSKDLFFQMREHEVHTLNTYPSKKEIQHQAFDLAKKIVDAGDEDMYQKLAEAIRIKEAVTVIEQTFRNALPDENFSAYGLKGTFKNGGATLNYKEDEKFNELQKLIDERKSLLDLASKSESEIYDSEGILVPKLSKINRKSSLNISF